MFLLPEALAFKITQLIASGDQVLRARTFLGA